MKNLNSNRFLCNEMPCCIQSKGKEGHRWRPGVDIGIVKME